MFTPQWKMYLIYIVLMFTIVRQLPPPQQKQEPIEVMQQSILNNTPMVIQEPILQVSLTTFLQNISSGFYNHNAARRIFTFIFIYFRILQCCLGGKMITLLYFLLTL